MNKDRRNTCNMLGRVCGSYTETPVNKVLFTLKDAVDDLIETEQRSIEKMEPHQDKLATKVNIQLAHLSKEHLELAAEALVDGDMEEAAEQLLIVAQGREEDSPNE